MDLVMNTLNFLVTNLQLTLETAMNRLVMPFHLVNTAANLRQFYNC